MKLYHSVCGYPVSVITDRISVNVIEFHMTDEETLEGAILDLVPKRSGKLTFSCPKCREDVDPKTDLTLDCTKCGNKVPVSQVHHVRPEWYLLCESCYTRIMRDKGKTPPIELHPIQFKIK